MNARNRSEIALLVKKLQSLFKALYFEHLNANKGGIRVGKALKFGILLSAAQTPSNLITLVCQQFFFDEILRFAYFRRDSAVAGSPPTIP